MNRERIERWEHTPTVEARVPWSDTAIAVVCRPFYSHRESMPGCTFSNLYPAEVSIDTTTELRDPGERFLVTPDGTVAFPAPRMRSSAPRRSCPFTTTSSGRSPQSGRRRRARDGSG